MQVSEWFAVCLFLASSFVATTFYLPEPCSESWRAWTELFSCICLWIFVSPVLVWFLFLWVCYQHLPWSTATPLSSNSFLEAFDFPFLILLYRPGLHQAKRHTCHVARTTTWHWITWLEGLLSDHFCFCYRSCCIHNRLTSVVNEVNLYM